MSMMETRYTSLQDSYSDSENAAGYLAISIPLNEIVVDHPALDEFFQSPCWSRSTETETPYDSLPSINIDELSHLEEENECSHLNKVSAKDELPESLPSMEIESDTRFQCLLAIILASLCSLACIICGIVFWVNFKVPLPTLLPKGLPSEAFSFFINIILTQCLEGVAYVHSISLRWSLLQENRLVFNTNIRLLTSSKHSFPNSWYMNCISALLLIICYGATSMLFMPNEGFPDIENYNFGTCVNLIALLALGFALLGQSLLALLSYWNNLRDIPSWGSNSLNTTLTMMIHGSVQRAPGRCMAPISTRGTSEAGLMLPRTEQPSQWQISKSARRAIVFIWALAGLSVIWFVAMILVTRSTVIYSLHFSELWAKLGWHFSLAWNPSQKDYMDQSYNAVSFSPDYLNDGSISVVSALVLGLVLVCAIQCLQTLGLHCAELIVDLSRDEDSWRGLDANSSSSRRQKVLRSPSFLKNFLSWKYDILFIFKSLLHWLLGQSVQPYFDERVFFAMYYSRLFVYAIFAICLASVLTFLVMKKPKGPQPATYGHIQTIADVVDDWSLNEEGQFWWGDKGCEGAIRHAGMSSVRDDLGPIKMEAYYAGQYTTQTIHSTTATTAQKN